MCWRSVGPVLARNPVKREGCSPIAVDRSRACLSQGERHVARGHVDHRATVPLSDEWRHSDENQGQDCEDHDQLEQRKAAFAGPWHREKMRHLKASSMMLRMALMTDMISPPTITPIRIVNAGVSSVSI